MFSKIPWSVHFQQESNKMMFHDPADVSDIRGIETALLADKKAAIIKII